MKEYELYHDESKVKGYWHGMLLVPLDKKGQLLEYLKTARNNTRYKTPLGIKRVKKKNRVFDAANAWIQIGVGFLRSKSKGKLYPIYLGERSRGKPKYEQLPCDCVGVKFVLFRETESHQDMSYYSDHASKIETTFRMGLKGGLHFLGKPEDGIHIKKMHFDGYEHYARHLDRSRIVDRLKGLRHYCSVSDRSNVIDDRSSDHRRDDSQSYDDCQLLQLTDLLIGGFRTALGEKTRNVHLQLAHPVKQIIARYQKGYARMKNSRWFRSFCMSQCYLDSGKWQFETIEYLGSAENSSQQRFMF